MAQLNLCFMFLRLASHAKTIFEQSSKMSEWVRDKDREREAPYEHCLYFERSMVDKATQSVAPSWKQNAFHLELSAAAGIEQSHSKWTGGEKKVNLISSVCNNCCCWSCAYPFQPCRHHHVNKATTLVSAWVSLFYKTRTLFAFLVANCENIASSTYLWHKEISLNNFRCFQVLPASIRYPEYPASRF